EDRDVPKKARAAVAWCESASCTAAKWEYVYVPQGVFERLTGDTISDLVRTCRPALQGLFEEDDPGPQLALPLAADEAPAVAALVDDKTLDTLPPRYRKAVEQATMLFRFFEKKEGMNYAPAFNALLGSIDEAAKGLLIRRLSPDMPPGVPDQKLWFDPYFGEVDQRRAKFYQDMAQNLKRTLVFRNGFSPLGLLRSCMDYALNDTARIGGVFEALKTRFKVKGGRELLSRVQAMNDFRNTFIAHQEQELVDAERAKRELMVWIRGLQELTEASAVPS
ncbi:MAG: restriction endonuclease subunit R, partial [Candidatus Eisenbacteria bacterium]